MWRLRCSVLLAMVLAQQAATTSAVGWPRAAGLKGRDDLTTDSGDEEWLERKLQAKSIPLNLFERMSAKQSNDVQPGRMMMMRMRMMRRRMMMRMTPAGPPVMRGMTAAPAAMTGNGGPSQTMDPDEPDTKSPTARMTTTLPPAAPKSPTMATGPGTGGIPPMVAPVPIIPTAMMTAAPVAPVVPGSTMKPTTKPPVRTRPPTSPAPVADLSGQGQRCPGVKNTISCFVKLDGGNTTDCRDFDWEENCHYRNLVFEYLVENTGATAATLQMVNVTEPFFNDDSDDSYLDNMANNPLGPGRSNKIVLERLVYACNHVSQNTTFAVRSVAVGGSPCTNTVLYSIVDARCVGIVSEFCGNI
jgi:hypothetical protein